MKKIELEAVSNQAEQLHTSRAHTSHATPSSREHLVTINVSGRKFIVDGGIFSRFPDTLLGSNIKNRFFDERRREYFFDRDPELFSYIVQFYRSGKLHFPEEECACSFASELDFFGIFMGHLGDCCSEIYEDKQEDYKAYLERRRNRIKPIEIKPKTIRQKAWKMFEDPGKNPVGLFLHYTSALFIVISVLASVVETIPCGHKTCGQTYAGEFFVTESICVILFTCEYVARLLAAPARLKFMKQFLSIIDVVAILPYYVALVDPAANSGPFTVLRVFRIFRIVKMSRHNTKVRNAGSSLIASLSELSFILVILIILLLLFSTVIYYTEIPYHDTKFKSIPDAFWYTIVTMTTLGYGDMVPQGFVGRISGAVCSLSGILVVALAAPILEKNFKEPPDDADDPRANQEPEDEELRDNSEDSKNKD